MGSDQAVSSASNDHTTPLSMPVQVGDHTRVTPESQYASHSDAVHAGPASQQTTALSDSSLQPLGETSASAVLSSACDDGLENDCEY